MPQVEIKPPEFSFQWIFIDFILFGLFGLVVLFLASRFTFLHWSRYGVSYLTPYFPAGNLNDFIFGNKSFATVFQELYELGKSMKQKISGIYLFTRPGVIINEPELIKTILITDFEFFQDRGIFYNGIHDPIAAYSSEVTGSTWIGHLDLFPEDLIQKLFTDIRECLATSYKNCSPTNTDTDDVNINSFVLNLMVSILGNTTFGLEYDQAINEEIKKVCAPPQPKWRMLANFGIGLYPELSILTNFVTRFIKLNPDVSFVNNNQLKLNENFNKVWTKIQRNDEPKKYDQDRENVTKAFKFFLNCLQMLNPLIIFTLYELARNVDIQEKLRKEINKVFYKIEDLNYQNLSKKFTYLDMVLKETLRKYPVNPLINRTCVRDYKVENTRQIINKGALIYIPVFSIHNDPKYYPNPEQFDPNRFASDKTIKECTYLPFGDGKRTCVGKTFGLLHVKLALIMILKQYQLNECSTTPTNIQFNPNIHFLATNQDIWLKFTKI